ncbi:TIGR03086 family metal-binding protein [Terracoccus luteus]|uniref:Uncharacterized protein (TIGR03086 family) n=1 Tax=Terracoccus luteus TaxID=53356 RepID=A0A839PSI6_9MICO|nr:TIGR03086 family metal-binding protein [Terracoccus luteus]MBB2987238.1 uncharacterized protein (TIGR03086 family) [Terracoccus luteus]MCP2172889.1 uncharacterized protein (TIGR03086 family) [Terracoccus luteus]
MTGPIADLPPADRYRALAARFTEIVGAVSDDRWGSPSPCDGWSARDVVAHVVQSQRGFLEGAGDPLPAGPWVDDDPTGAWAATRDGVQQVLDDPARARREVPGRAGRGPLEDTVGMFHSVDLVVHGWDLAQAAGLDATVPRDQLAWARGLVTRMADLARSPGGFGPEVEAWADADETTRTMAFLGRRPVGD